LSLTLATAAFPLEGPLWSALCFILFTLSYINTSLWSTAAGTTLFSLALGVAFDGVPFDGVPFAGVILDGVAFLAVGDLGN